MEVPELRMSFSDRAALTRELDQNIYRGRAFLQQTAADVPVLSECVLVLIHPEHGAELRLNAQVVMINKSGPMYGVGLALPGMNEAELARLSAFAQPAAVSTVDWSPPAGVLEAARSERTTLEQCQAVTAPPSAAAEDLADEEQTLRLMFTDRQPTLSLEAMTVRPTAGPATLTFTNMGDELESEDPLLSEADNPDFPRSQEEELHYHERTLSERANASEVQSDTRQQRLRSLNAAEQLKVARTGELTDRVTVERLYGKQVWDALLHNPRLTIPEVARIARKGTVPKPLLELILENAGWIKADAVRRALLSNPKIGADAVLKLLRITPKAELKIIEKGSAYGPTVRDNARKLLKQ